MSVGFDIALASGHAVRHQAIESVDNFDMGYVYRSRPYRLLQHPQHTPPLFFTECMTYAAELMYHNWANHGSISPDEHLSLRAGYNFRRLLRTRGTHRCGVQLMVEYLSQDLDVFHEGPPTGWQLATVEWESWIERQIMRVLCPAAGDREGHRLREEDLEQARVVRQRREQWLDEGNARMSEMMLFGLRPDVLNMSTLPWEAFLRRIEAVWGMGTYDQLELQDIREELEEMRLVQARQPPRRPQDLTLGDLDERKAYLERYKEMLDIVDDFLERIERSRDWGVGASRLWV